MLLGLDAESAGFHADELHGFVVEERIKKPMAFEPPPTHAMSMSGKRFSFSKFARALRRR